MGRAPRPRPSNLPAKLLLIRNCLGFTQEQMLQHLDYHQSPLCPNHLSEFEKGKREPPLPLLLLYARLAGVALEILIDDALDLPEPLPSEASLHSDYARESDSSVSRRISGLDRKPQQTGRCPFCGATERQVRAGVNPVGTQRYKCQNCCRRYTPEARLNGHPEEMRRQAVELYESGVRNFRRIARQLKVNPQSVANWIYAHYGQLALADTTQSPTYSRIRMNHDRQCRAIR